MAQKVYKPRRQIIAELHEKKDKELHLEEKLEQHRETWKLVKEKIREIAQIVKKNGTRWFQKYRRHGKRFVKASKSLLVIFFHELGSRLAGFAKHWLSLRKGLTAGSSRTLEKSAEATVALFIKHRYWILSSFFLILTSINLAELKGRYPLSDLNPHIQAVNYWPMNLRNGLTFSQQAIGLGYETLAIDQLKKTKLVLDWWKQLGLETAFLPEFEATHTLVYSHQRKRSELTLVNQLLERYPFSIPLLLRKAELLYILRFDEEIAEIVARVRWLDPHMVLGEIGRIEE